MAFYTKENSIISTRLPVEKLYFLVEFFYGIRKKETYKTLQWRIQDFPNWGRQPPRWGPQCIIWPNFLKAEWKWKKLDPEGGPRQIRQCININKKLFIWIFWLFSWSSGGSRGARDAPPPLGLISFIFMQLSAKFWPINKLASLPWGWRPPSRKSWIRHCHPWEISILTGVTRFAWTFYTSVHINRLKTFSLSWQNNN